MDAHTFLVYAVIYLMAAVISVPLFKHFGLGAVLGYLAAGVVIGPWGLGLVGNAEASLHFAEFGVVLLLFIIGLELNPSRLWVFRHSIFGLGSLQVLLTVGLIIPVSMWLGLGFEAAFVVACALALSSTAFALQTLAERNQLSAQHGRKAFAVLLFQDLAVIPLLAIVPLLGPSESGEAGFQWMALLKAAAVILAVIVGGHYLLRPVLRAIARIKLQEIFTALALLIALGTALLMETVGLSMALGAFLAGVLLADSEYRHELEADIEPFKGLLLGMFFLAVGMTVNVGLILAQPGIVLGLAVALIALKFLILFIVGRLGGLNSASAVRLAAIMPQGGEFGFVILGAAVAAGVLGGSLSEQLIVVITLSMAMTPVLFAICERLLDAGKQAEPDYDAIEEDEPFVVIAGFGRVGQIPGRILRGLNVPFTALESDSTQVDFVRRFGNQVYYGDASRLELLRAAQTDRARAIVIALDDMVLSVETARQVITHFPHVPVLARARNRQHAHMLMDMGVHYVVRDTLASSLELSEQLLGRLGYNRGQSGEIVRAFRERDEALLHRQHEIHEDTAALIETVKEFQLELEELFQADAKSTGQPPGDGGNEHASTA